MAPIRALQYLFWSIIKIVKLKFPLFCRKCSATTPEQGCSFFYYSPQTLGNNFSPLGKNFRLSKRKRNSQEIKEKVKRNSKVVKNKSKMKKKKKKICGQGKDLWGRTALHYFGVKKLDSSPSGEGQLCILGRKLDFLHMRGRICG